MDSKRKCCTGKCTGVCKNAFDADKSDNGFEASHSGTDDSAGPDDRFVFNLGDGCRRVPTRGSRY